ncbi:ATP-grasp domain-containing protein [Pelagibius sp. Alg239-R121]|uniref:ATP-grasp domain-containing protein n=1 Tax=Pelagibius sp. Alg239-R121 TaxID=2993448 RepID=UPI0024A72467|nr:ATP-grasp domain-containing protein [Pelagibius sp. Alg239-R121]
MKTILVTAIGGDIAQAAATIIREAFPDWRIIGSDMKDRHGGQLFTDALEIAPAASDGTYETWLGGLINRKSIDLCLPLSEAELGFFLERGLTTLAGADIITPGLEALSVGTDKFKTAQFLENHGIPGPWTLLDATALTESHLPCIYKPRTGVGSKSVFVCHELEAAALYAKFYPGGVFQELLLPADQEITCAVYRSREGEIAVLQMLRELTGGFTGWAQVIENHEILGQCSQLAEALDVRGSINVQLRLTEVGPRIFEINSRFSSTTLMRHRMGFQDLAWTLTEIIGEPVKTNSPPAGTTAVRVQAAAVLDVDREENDT